MSQDQKPKAYFYLAEFEFLAPYLEREFAAYSRVYNLDDDGATADVAVMISSTDIYDVVEGMNYDENTPVKTDSDLAKHEQIFRDICNKHNLKPTILRCANIIGTGMIGLPMRLARGIARGTMTTIKDNDAVISTVHAIDVARIALQLAASGTTFNVTNGIDTPVSSMVDALSHRIKDKRVFQLSARWARLLYGAEYFKTLTTTLTFNNIRMMHALDPDTQLTDIVQYLNNHDYSNDTI